jgi:hypothetical protein
MSRTQQRLVLTVIVAVATAIVSWNLPPYAPGMKTDFAWVWSGARAWLDGLNPYESVGPGRLYPLFSPLWYPMPAIVVGVPFSFVSLQLANALFLGLSAALMVWGITRRAGNEPQLLLFASFAWSSEMFTAQWAPLMMGAALTPAFGFLLTCKPTLGAALFAGYPSRLALLGAATFGVLTLILWPWWLPSWLETIRATHQTAPVMHWGGPLVLLALLKWRRPEARLLLAMACVPHTANLYETLPLFLIVSTWFESIALVLLNGVVYFGVQAHMPAYPDRETYLLAVQQWIVIAIYLPCTLLLLRRKNEGEMPVVVERWLTRFQGMNPLRRWM